MSNYEKEPGTGPSLNPRIFAIIGVLLIALIIILIMIFNKGDAKPAATATPVATAKTTPAPTPEPTAVAEQFTPAPVADLAALEAVIAANTPIYFVKDSIKLRKGELAKVEAIAEALKGYKNIHLFFKGHTAAYNRVAYRYALSKARADRIRWAIENRAGEGITSVTVKGYGSTRQVSKGDSEEKRAPNRRVEIILQNAETK